MRHARLPALTLAAILVIAACSSTSPSTSPAAPSVAPSTAPSVAAPGAPSVAPSVAPSIAASPSTAASAATGDAVSIANFSFQPATIAVPVGATVTWKNNDNVRHTVTANDGSFGSDRLVSGNTFSQTFAKAGTFAYHCAIHSAMTGTVTVR